MRPNEKYQSYSPWGIEKELPLRDSALWDLWGPEKDIFLYIVGQLTYMYNKSKNA